MISDDIRLLLEKQTGFLTFIINQDEGKAKPKNTPKFLSIDYLTSFLTNDKILKKEEKYV